MLYVHLGMSNQHPLGPAMAPAKKKANLVDSGFDTLAVRHKEKMPVKS